MDPITIITIGTAAINGVAQAIAAWPVLSAIVTGQRDPTPEEQATLDAAMDAAHAALQGA